MAEGVFAFLGIAKQNSFGTPITTSLEFIPFTDESITEAIDILRPETLTGNFFEVDAVRGLESIDGDFNTVMHPEMAGVLLNAVFGQTITTTAGIGSGYFEHEFIPKNSNFEAGVALPPHTIEVYRNTETAFEYTDAQLHSLSISLAVNEFLKMNVGVMAKVASLMTVVSGTAPSNRPWVFDQASVSLAGTAFIEFETIEMSFTNNVEGNQTLDATRQNRFFQRAGKMEARLSGVMNFLNNSAYVDFKAFTRQALTVTMRDTTVTSGNEISIQFPRFRFDEYTPNVGGAERITANFTGTAEVDSNSSYAVRVTLINSRSAY